MKKIWITMFAVAALISSCGGGSGGSAPAAPTGLTVTISDNAGELVISWTASADATSYNLYWSNTATTASAGTKIENVTSPYTHTALTNGTRYYYAVTAVNGNGESAASTEANGQPQINPVGVLDTDLATTGYLIYTAQQSYASGVVVDSDGRIVIAGTIIVGANFSMAVWRYNADGTADTSFSGDGLVTVTGTAGGNIDEGTGVVIDSAGKILVAGYSENAAAKSRMVIWRFNADGTADTSFGTNGSVIYDRGLGQNDSGNGIALDSSGRILVAGSSQNAVPDNDMALWRYTDAGVLDTTFNGSGVVFHNNAAGGNAQDEGAKVAINSTGGIAVVGNSRNATNTDFVIWRFTDAGVLDTSFSVDGIAIFDRGSGDDGEDVTFDSQERVLATGNSDVGFVGDLVVLRYTAAGELDTTFSGDGVVIYQTGNGDAGHAIMMDSRQRPVVVGSSGLPGNDSDMIIIRLTDDGSFDTTFGTNGIVLFNYGSQDSASGLAFDATGRILAAGSTEEPGTANMIFWRYK